MALEDDLREKATGSELVVDGDAAIARGIGGAFDLILLDVMLPDRDGFDVCRELRGAGVDIPIVLFTARVQESEKVLGLEPVRTTM